MEPQSEPIARVGTVVCPRQRPATPLEVWVELVLPTTVALRDLLLIDGPKQQLIGTVVDLEMVNPQADAVNLVDHDTGVRVAWAKLSVLSASDEQLRLPEGTVVRHPTADEVTTLVGEARRIPLDQRVPLGVLPVHEGFAPIYGDLRRIVGPVSTSMLISGAAGSLKSSSGMLALAGIQRVTQGRAALVVVNSKGNDFLFADYARQAWAKRLGCPPLGERDMHIYKALGFAEPPVLRNVTALVPMAHDPDWRSARPVEFPRTSGYRLSHRSAIRYACAPTDDEEMATSVVTRQAIEEASGPFAAERGVRVLSELVALLETEFESLTNAHTRWRNQFQSKTVGAALRQLRAAQRDLGPILAEIGEEVALPVEDLAAGGTWIVDVASLPSRAAQAVVDELVHTLWQAKARAIIPFDVPLVLLVDELNRWSAGGPTGARLAALVRDQRHRHFCLIGICQQLSSLNEQLLANADTFWIGSTKSRELIEDVYHHLPPHIVGQLHRLPPGQRLLDMWPLAQPLIAEIPYPSWLIGDEGLGVVDAWHRKQRAAA